MDYSVLPKKWQERFEFFDKYGSSNTPEYKAAFKQLAFKKRITIGMSITAFFFGFIYFFVLGLWRKNLAIVGITVVLSIILGLILPPSMSNSVGIVGGVLYGMTANYAYYLHVVKGSTSWNPFEGIRLI